MIPVEEGHLWRIQNVMTAKITKNPEQEQKMRLFVAIPFSDAFKKTLGDIMWELKNRGVEGNFTPPERLHMTICFIGESSRSEEIIDALRGITWKPFSLTLSELGHFKDLIWIGTNDCPELHVLVQDIRNALAKIGVGFDQKPFKPHITLVRKSNKFVSDQDCGGNLSSCAGSTLRVKTISLMRSDRIAGKLVYKEIHSLNM